jgi:hypothetical protein
MCHCLSWHHCVPGVVPECPDVHNTIGMGIVSSYFIRMIFQTALRVTLGQFEGDCAVASWREEPQAREEA